MDKFYVYAYLRANYTPYYIGKGCGKRCYIGQAKRHAKKPKNPLLIIKLNSGLSEDEAFEWEKFYIKVLGLSIEGGLLHNFDYGGRGCSHTKETKLKISTTLTGRTLSSQHRQSIITSKINPITLINNQGASITFERTEDCASYIGVTRQSIYQLRKGLIQSCKGYKIA